MTSFFSTAVNLPEPLRLWFDDKGWDLHDHQVEMIDVAKRRQSCLLVAPTGTGKTLAGFLPSLIDLADTPAPGLHTLYISPLKALAVDIERNLTAPLAAMKLDIRAETRTGDTPPAKRQRQRERPPHILELMLTWPNAAEVFSGLNTVILDELHALAGNKRGDLLALSLSRLRRLAPDCRSVGLSATVADPEKLTGWLDHRREKVEVVRGGTTASPELSILTKAEDLPWAGHSAAYAVDDIFDMIKSHTTTLVFVNTRAQAEILFQSLWRINDDNLPIGLHHGSLSAEQRRKVEAHMAKGGLRAVVATSSLDLGIDWADIDLVVQVGAPKGTARLLQRIGRSGHRYDLVSKAVLVPANRFEVFECMAAEADIRDGLLDDPDDHPGGLDVLAQHLVGMALSDPFHADDLYHEVREAHPYRDLPRQDFNDTLEFVTTGGYALKAYERYHKLALGKDGLYRIAHRSVGLQWRLNAGTIVETNTLNIRLRGGPKLGKIEEYFVQSLTPGDTFIFAGRVLAYVGMQGAMTVLAAPTTATEPKVPAYAGGRLPLTSNLAERIRALMVDKANWPRFPDTVRQWLSIQEWKSSLPGPDRLLVETFPRGKKQFCVIYGFEGRNAHQTLGMLITRRMERTGLKPIGFVATDYALAVWSLNPVTSPEELLSPDLLGDDLEEWMKESTMMKRSFRTVATIAGLLEKRHPGAEEKSGRQMTMNSDLIYDVLLRHQPDHILMRATRQEAARGLTDIKRLAELLTRFQGRLDFRQLERVSPLAMPLMLEVGREAVTASAVEDGLAELQAELMDEAMDGVDLNAPLQSSFAL
ncbi:MAG: ligase-associated DNA damage response DEXH box helicase [Alphaproteobacteria bacterium]|nr:ligase-associated DNA damage response DEXH box helicase [Alphaproteobacteria bacterium]